MPAFAFKAGQSQISFMQGLNQQLVPALAVSMAMCSLMQLATKFQTDFLQGVSRDGPKDEDMTGPLLLIDTTGCDMVEEVDDDFDDSKLNPGEARVALQHCRRLLDAGVAMTDIGIITPYSAQVCCCRRTPWHELLTYPLVLLWLRIRGWHSWFSSELLADHCAIVCLIV